MEGIRDLLEVVTAVFEGAGVQVYRWDAAPQLLVPEMGNALALADGPKPRMLGVGAAGRAAERRTPVLIDNYRVAVGQATPAGVAGVTAAMGAPLLHKGRLVGAVSVGIEDAHQRLGPDDLTALAVLAEGWSNGNRLALLEAIYVLCRRRAVGLAYRLLQDRAAAEDIAQEVFLALWRSGARHDPARGSLHAWVLAMVRYRAIDWLRAHRRRPTCRITLEHVERPSAANPAAEALDAADRERVSAALASLPAEQRHTIELAFFGELSHTQIAQLQQLPLGTVKGRIRLGLDRLRGRLDLELAAS